MIPKISGYRIRQEVLVLDDGAQSHRVVKVSVAEVADWDAKHDAVGHLHHGGAVYVDSKDARGGDEASDPEKTTT